MLAVALAAVVPLADSAGAHRAVTFTVDSTADEIDADPRDGVCRSAAGHCTLRAALRQAADTPAPVMVSVPAGTYVLRIDPPGDFRRDFEGGDLDTYGPTTGPLVVTGAGAGLTIVEQRRGDRVFETSGVGPVTIANLTMRGGRAAEGGGIKNGTANGLTLRAVEITGNTATEAGGGIAGASPLTLDASVVSDNTAAFGGGIRSAGQPLTITGGTISGNTATGTSRVGGAGGGIWYQNGPRLDISRSLIANNTASGPSTAWADGGGVLVSSERGATTAVHIAFSAIRGNVARAGGGLELASSGALTIDQSLFASNTAELGGGLEVSNTHFELVHSLVMTNTTLSGNAAERGGAILRARSATCTAAACDPAATTLRAVTMAGNTAPAGSGIIVEGGGPRGYAVVHGAILANEPASENCTTTGGPFTGRIPLTEPGTNIETGTRCFLTGSDRSSTNPLLGPLADNGGPTETRALLPGSPAIDRYTAGDCPSADQRAYVRPAGAACDVGAFERDAHAAFAFVLLRPVSDVIRGVLTLIPGGAHTMSLRGGDFRPCTPGKSMRLGGAHGFFESRDAQVALRGDVVFRRNAQKLVRFGNLLVLLDGTRGRVVALLAPTRGPLPLFTLEGLRYGQGTVHGRMQLAPAAAQLLNRLLGLQGFRAGMPCGQLDLRLAIGRNPGPPPPVDISPPPPPPPPPQQQTFTLSVSVEPSDGGEVDGPGINCPGDCSETYTAGTGVTLTRDAADNFEFDEWDGACGGGSSSCSLTMDSDKSVTAKFKAKQQQKPECSDGKDNDNDGFTDFSGQDPQCSSPNDDSEKQ